MKNPFNDESSEFLALINAEGQYSLWPSFANVPPGWKIIHQKAARNTCLDYINQQWTDMRPKSLIESRSDACSALDTPCTP
jgi:MbtH protein